MLTMYSSIAQEESDSLSDSVNWGIQRRNEQGKVRKVKTYGYDVGKDNEYIVNEEQAGVVRLIFELYLNGYSYFMVGCELEKRGIKTPRGNDKWDSTTIEGMLKNEKYTGDVLLQKTIAKPWVQKKRSASADNQMYLVENALEPIISKEVFERTKREMAYRKSLRSCTKSGRGGYSSKYPFSSKVYCYGCGSIFRRHGYYADREHTREHWVYTWTCSNHKNNGNRACTQNAIKETDLENSFIRVVNMIVTDKAQMIQNIKDSITEALGERLTGARAEALKEKIADKQKELVKLVRATGTAGNSIDESVARERLVGDIKALTSEMTALENQATEMGHTSERLTALCELISEQTILTEFDGTVFRKMVNRITVDGRELTYDLGSGITITDTI